MDYFGDLEAAAKGMGFHSRGLNEDEYVYAENDEMFTLGQIAQHLFPGRFPDNLPCDLLDLLMTQPATGLQLMMAGEKDSGDGVLNELLDRIPANFSDPGKGQRVDSHAHARFITGCKARGETGTQDDEQLPMTLADIGQLIYGWDWQHRMAVGLGIADKEQIGRWNRKEEPIPLDVWWQLYNQVHQRYTECFKAFPKLFDFIQCERTRQNLPSLI